MAIILVADDDPSILQLLKIFLRHSGYTAIGAANGQEVLDQVDGALPDLILMDLNMPRVTGWEATSRLKGDPRTAAIPILAITAHGMGAELDRAYAAGVDGILSKPLELEMLRATIQNHLQTHEACIVAKDLRSSHTQS